MGDTSVPSGLFQTPPGVPSSGERRRPALGRWQFSLGGLLLFVLLVAMGISLFVTAR